MVNKELQKLIETLNTTNDIDFRNNICNEIFKLGLYQQARLDIDIIHKNIVHEYINGCDSKIFMTLPGYDSDGMS